MLVPTPADLALQAAAAIDISFTVPTATDLINVAAAWVTGTVQQNTPSVPTHRHDISHIVRMLCVPMW